MRSPSELLAQLGDCQLSKLIEMTDSPLLTEQVHTSAAGWIFGYLMCLKDLGHITAEEYETWAAEPGQLAVAIKPEE